MLSIVALVYVGMCLCGYFFAEGIIFQPQPSSYRDSDRIIKLSSGDGVRISAVYLRNPNARYVILYSHGNAEDIGQLLPMLEEIRAMGFSVLAYDYRGYGTSAGTPSERGAYEDEDAAYDYLITNGVAADRVIALGHSLGGAVAIDLARRRNVGGLIVESSFVTAFRVMTHIPLLPFDKFRSLPKIKSVRCPVLVIHGKNDEVIPLWHGERIFAEANGPKLSFWPEGAGHNDIFEASGRRYAQALRDFTALIERAAKPTPPPSPGGLR